MKIIYMSILIIVLMALFLFLVGYIYNPEEFKDAPEIFCGENNSLTTDYKYEKGVYYCNNKKFVCFGDYYDEKCFYVLEEKG